MFVSLGIWQSLSMFEQRAQQLMHPRVLMNGSRPKQRFSEKKPLHIGMELQIEQKQNRDEITKMEKRHKITLSVPHTLWLLTRGIKVIHEI